ncbi:MAG: hypothetical protein LQ337_008660 [Flavoplaca oasis]|nr:MAG: hypothetical protein LQ337_008660 [Flavoplaca oasis]
MPKRPLDFRTTHRYTSPNLLNPIRVYSGAIASLSENCIHGWNELIFPHPFAEAISSPPHSTIDITIQPAPGETTTRMRYSHLFFALHEAISIMSQEVFAPLSIYIHVHDILIGMLSIQGLPPQNTLYNIPNTLPSSDILPANSSLTANDDSGTYLDPHNRYAIPYSWSAPRINSKDIFTCIMEAIIIIAHDGAARSFQYLNAVSVSGNVALHVKGISAPGEEKDMGLVVVKPLLVKVAGLFIQQRRFDTLDFAYEEVRERGERVRRFEGWFFKVGDGGVVEE